MSWWYSKIPWMGLNNVTTCSYMIYAQKIIKKYNLREKVQGQHQTYALGLKEVIYSIPHFYTHFSIFILNKVSLLCNNGNIKCFLIVPSVWILESWTCSSHNALADLGYQCRQAWCWRCASHHRLATGPQDLWGLVLVSYEG